MIANRPLVVICGPTATGKTNTALTLAQKFNGELVSADSRQLYKLLNIGTGKDLPKDALFSQQNSKFASFYKTHNIAKNRTIGYYMFKNIPLWLYDIVSPEQYFSAYEYALIAQAVIRSIWKRNKTPILIGGTGLYIMAVVDGLDNTTPANLPLRKSLEHKSVSYLQQTLLTVNKKTFDSLNRSDQLNPRRLIRAIERELSAPTIGFNNITSITNNVLFIGLSQNNACLYDQIDSRVEIRIKQGLLTEISQLLELGYLWNSPGLCSLGYKEWRPYFEKEETIEETVRRWKFDEHAYARRQKTWFKKDARIQWFTSTDRHLIKKIERLIENKL